MVLQQENVKYPHIHRNTDGTKHEHDGKYDHTGGPHGYGDPESDHVSIHDLTLIRNRQYDLAYYEKCKQEATEFFLCDKKEKGKRLFWKCKAPLARMNDCLAKWMQDDFFFDEVKKQYLFERSYYRRTGEPHPDVLQRTHMEKLRKERKAGFGAL
ncbi:uncharacterized protein LOC106151738 [Lingula anatina]|uniref:COX assembly mitochondrial protein n=1 Tax=Lingula anatina TaxID=7574 RepID=A0A1S3H3K1_LINAN|nr:uncharacterized protein LOC106151738 [Lingula anatina]|eukprot:XP_013380578.1 uncharacterized protein LOC106151738 [Lingula anatina]